MLRTTALVQSPHFAVRAVACTDEHAGWSEPETTTEIQIVLVARGRFRVQTNGRTTTADPTTAYVHAPGDRTRFSHPAGGDVCTAITVRDGLDPGVDRTLGPAVHVDGRLELAHRRLLGDQPDPDFETVERVIDLLQLAFRRRPDESPAPGRYELAERAREALLADEPAGAGLVTLANLLGTSASHLSRTFRHHTGMSVSRYRNRVRISRALYRIQEGETDLAGLAASLGFSDQAHLSRTMRAESGETPGAVRALLGGVKGTSMPAG